MERSCLPKRNTVYSASERWALLSALPRRLPRAEWARPTRLTWTEPVCGICGYAGLDGRDGLLASMVGLLRHRGPDDHGALRDGEFGIGVRRLSIIDVEGGHQPILSEDGSVAAVLNGEIYNYRSLGEELGDRGHEIRTRSDTEVLVHAYEEFGPGFVRRLDGMFGLAVLDRKRRRLLLARDRIGIKPLYVWRKGRRLLFGSEVKCLLASDRIDRRPDLEAVDAYLTLRYVPGPGTLFEGVEKFPPAHWMTWEDGEVSFEQYWRPEAGNYLDCDTDELQGEFRERFRQSVRERLMSDVPFGAYLSGGVDSTAVVATMNEFVDHPVRTFSVGFGWSGDETSAAREVATRLGCEHHEVTCRSEDLGLLPEIIWHLDEPVGDAIVVPMFLLSRLAQQHVKVVLTGEGADELLAGYLPHAVLRWSERFRRLVPEAVQRGLVSPLLSRTPASLLDRAFRHPGTLGTRGRRKLLDYLPILYGEDLPARYHFLISLFDARDKEALYAPRLQAAQTNGTGWGLDALLPRDVGAGHLDRALGLQFAHWLPDDILMKQDKMAMANSVEGRVPFLDHQLVEFLLQVPPRAKLRGLKDKVLLRNYLGELVPPETRDRPKQAFYIPVDKYLHEPPLSDIVRECLSEDSVRRRGYFRWEHVQRLLRAAEEERDFLYGKQIFALVMLELWHRIYIDEEKGWGLTDAAATRIGRSGSSMGRTESK